MSRTYQATGINLKGIPLGESDRLLTILTKEYGLIRAVAPGARKSYSQLSGRSGLFVVNQLLLSQGRSLDKITQAETLASYPGLAKDLGKLAAGQYLAEIVLCQALSNQPQEELYGLLNEHLTRIEKSGKENAIAHLTHAIFHLLVLAGIAPQVQICCLTGYPITPNFSETNWRVGFSVATGGIINLKAINKNIENISSAIPHPEKPPTLNAKLNAIELAIFQQLAQPKLPQISKNSPANQHDINTAWFSIENILRQYAQYHFGRSIKSAPLMDNYFHQ